MTEQPRVMIAVDETLMQSLIAEVQSLRRAIDRVQMTPRPEWVTVQAYAEMTGRTTKTVREWVREGKVDSRRDGTVLMIRAS